MKQSRALDILKTGCNAFITGEPGSGKTHTINQYVQYLREHNIEPAITASTGIAATHIGGMTIHSWSGIGIREHLTKRDIRDIADKEHVARRIQKTRILIIDEVSMLLPSVLDMVDSVIRAVKETTEPFGGMQVIFVGDFFQLPPIKKRAILPDEDSLFSQAEEASATFAYESLVWQQLEPVVCYITEQHRQDDAIYLEILSAIRAGSTTREHVAHLTNRHCAEHAIPAGIPKLYTHNADVDSVNMRELAQLGGKHYAYTMASAGSANLVKALKKGCLSPERLQLSVGAQVMFTKNNPQLGFVNGTLGVVESFDPESKHPVVRTKEGKRIYVSAMEWVIEEQGKIRASITQMPLRLAWAITVHKSQGMSMDAASMNLSNVFEYGQGYVALSRVRRLSGLHMLGWSARALEVHPLIREQDAVFQASAAIADDEISNYSKKKLTELHEEFILKTGGTLARVAVQPAEKLAKKSKIPTHMETFALWQAGKTFTEIAEARSLKETTIVSHIEKLVQEKKIALADIECLLSPRIKKALPSIIAVFKKQDDLGLTAVYEHFKKKYSYEELRFARMFVE